MASEARSCTTSSGPAPEAGARSAQRTRTATRQPLVKGNRGSGIFVAGPHPSQPPQTWRLGSAEEPRVPRFVTLRPGLQRTARRRLPVVAHELRQAGLVRRRSGHGRVGAALPQARSPRRVAPGAHSRGRRAGRDLDEARTPAAGGRRGVAVGVRATRTDPPSRDGASDPPPAVPLRAPPPFPTKAPRPSPERTLRGGGGLGETRSRPVSRPGDARIEGGRTTVAPSTQGREDGIPGGKDGGESN